MSSWDSSLDALEQWVRTVAESPEAPAPELPAGPVPPALAVRARALSVAMDDAQASLRGAREALRRGSAYSVGRASAYAQS